MDGMFTALIVLAVSAALGVLGWAFRSWASTVKSSMDSIVNKLDALNLWMHEHATLMERRVTRVETKVDVLLHEDEDHRG